MPQLLAKEQEFNERVKAVKHLQAEKERGEKRVAVQKSKRCKSNLNEWGHIIDVAISDLTGETLPPFDN